MLRLAHLNPTVWRSKEKEDLDAYMKMRQLSAESTVLTCLILDIENELSLGARIGLREAVRRGTSQEQDSRTFQPRAVDFPVRGWLWEEWIVDSQVDAVGFISQLLHLVYIDPQRAAP
jgi:hypothetical protein